MKKVLFIVLLPLLAFANDPLAPKNFIAPSLQDIQQGKTEDLGDLK